MARRLTTWRRCSSTTRNTRARPFGRRPSHPAGRSRPATRPRAALGASGFEPDILVNAALPDQPNGRVRTTPTKPERVLMAETVHLYLKANGTDIKGESSQTSLGRQDS